VNPRASPRLRSSCCASDGFTGRPAPFIFRPCRRWSFELPRLSHPSAELALETRVAPHIRCTSAASQRAFELPRSLVFRLLPVMDLRWPPNLASFVGPGVESPGSPESSPSSAVSRSVSGSPRILDLPALAEVESPGCPEASFSSARWLVAVRVSPLPAPSGDASGEFPGRPESSLLWLRLLWGFESPRNPALQRSR
jgi:hypothetical protein